MALRTLTLALALGLALPSWGNQLRYLPHGEDALMAFHDGISKAQKSLDLTYFIFEPCHTSTRVLTELLQKKAQKGVRVRVLLDSFMHTPEVHERIAGELMAAGVEFKSYNRGLLRYSPMANHRSHVKLLITDGREFITGGRNIGDDYFSLAEGVNFIDRDVIVQGASAKQASRDFEMLWNSRLSKGFQNIRFAKTDWTQVCDESHKKAVSAASIQRLKAFIQDRKKSVLSKLPVRSCKQVQVYTDDPAFLSVQTEQDRDSGHTPYMTEMRLKKKAATREFVQFLRAAQRKLEIENWSYIPNDSVDAAFRDLRRRQVPTEIVTNGSAAAGGFIDSGFDAVLAKMSRRDNQGSQVILQMPRTKRLSDRHALTPKSADFKLHGKVAIRDGVDVQIGSYNIDPRSYHTNLESLIVAKNCADLAQDVRAPITALGHLYVQSQTDPNAVQVQDQAQAHRVLGYLMFHFL